MTPISQELIRRRKERGLTVEDISAKTRIRTHVLEAIEQGNFDVLPAAYIRSYLKIYAQLVGLSDDELVVLWNESTPGAPELSGMMAQDQYTSLKYDGRQYTAHARPEPVKISKPFIATLVYSAVTLCAGVLVYYFFFRTDPTSTLALRPGELAGTTTISDDTSTGGGMLSYFDSAFPADSIILEAQTSDTAWMTINMDGQRSQQITIFPTQQLRFSAKEFFILSLGNAGVISLKRNGTALQQFGEKGTIVRQVKITAKDVIASSEPYKPQTTATAPAPTASAKSATAKPPATTAVQPKPAQTSPPKQAQTPKQPATQAPTPPATTAKSNAEPPKNDPNGNVKKEHTATTVHDNGTQQPPAKPPAAKQKPSVAPSKKQAKNGAAPKQKQPQPPSALDRILKNTAKENKKQKPDIVPATPMTLRPKEQKNYVPPPIPPVEKKPDER